MPDETPDPTDEGTPARQIIDRTGTGSDDSGADTDTPPEDAVEAAERLTRLARQAVDGDEADAYRADRDELLAAHDYNARVREDETRDVLVLHPEEWKDGNDIRPERIDDLDRGIEIPLSGPGEGDDWEAIDEHNRDIVAEVRENYGDVHAENVAALADFMGNHYAKPIDDATDGELREFLEEYFPRNAWPTDEQRSVVEESVENAFAVAGEPYPLQ